MNINDDFCEMAKPAERLTPVHPKNILAPIDSDASGAEEIDYAISAIREVVNRLRALSPRSATMVTAR